MLSHLKWTSNPHRRKILEDIRSNVKCKEHAHHLFNLLGMAKDLGSSFINFYSFRWSTNLAFQISKFMEIRWKFPVSLSGSIAGFIWSVIPHALLWERGVESASHSQPAIVSAVAQGDLQTQGWFGRWLSTPSFHPVGVLASNRGYQ